MAFDFGNANDEQRIAISSTDGPLLIIAGPGTGKTYTLVKRIVYLITEKNIAPEEIMVATFTEKAAKELVTRITNELYELGISLNLNEMYIGTFHSICLRILKDHLEYTRIKKNYRMLDQFDQQYMVFQRISKFRQLPCYDAIFDDGEGAWKQAGKIVKYVNNLAEELVDIEQMQSDGNEEVVAIANIIEQYQIIMEDENLIDFSSIQTETYKLLNEHPDILAGLHEKIKYVMVDEYQDTNYIQELLVFLIAGSAQNICVVGDDDQGLYRFRGATIRNILEFPGHFKNGKCKQVKLVTNYRSEKEIIDFYNTWMSTTDGRKYDFLWRNFRFPKEIVPGKDNYREGTSVIRCSGQEIEDDWYEAVYRFICDLKKKNILLDYNQIAFLCRSVKNDRIIRLIEYLEEKGIKIYSPRSDMFFSRKEIKEAIGCLMLCFPEYLRKLQARDFDYNFAELYDYYDGECIHAAKELITTHKDSLGRWIAEKMIAHGKLSQGNTDYAFVGLLYQLFQFEPFSSYLDIDMKSGVTDERPARNLSMLTSVLGKYEYLHRIDVFTEKNIDSGVSGFFNHYFRFLFDGGITEYEDDSEYAPSGCVSFMTIHQSKGMEFPIVIVDSLNGTPRSDNNQLLEDIETRYFHREAFETRDDIKFFDFWRLYYTAFSRAQNLLVLSCCEKSGRGQTPSKYFEECYGKLPYYEDADLNGLKLEKVKPVNIKDTYSFTSHIALYENCALQYKIFKELGFTQVRVGATLFGTLVHETIEDVHRAAMRHEEDTINPESIREWFDANYSTLSKSEHSYLGPGQLDSAYDQVIRYAENNKDKWGLIQDAEVEVSLVKPDYILLGKVDLIRGEGDTVEIVDFKSEKKPDLIIESEQLNKYRKQLEVYAHLIEEKTGKRVSKMHLYYTGEENGVPTVSFDKSPEKIDETIKEFDEVVSKIQNKDFSSRANDKKLCANCDMRHYCKRKGDC
ncbi:ATP-dependent helicase [Butyrivibrio sp. VCB2006]|uniref:ATP-dependent helicase n=1 Tax=Butyrivibrio sp. VCB2006 TaxID=1280679 RepID=UPI00041F5003|nr:ATP-dependent DNA helicase [Butyrivibrio sp. VCB2006]